MSILTPKFIAAVALNASTYVQIDLTTLAVKSILLQCRSAIDVYLANSGTPGEAYLTLKSGSVLTMDVDGKQITGIIYAKSASTTPSLEIFILQ